MNPSESPSAVKAGVFLCLFTYAGFIPCVGAQAETINKQRDAQIGGTNAILGHWTHSSEEEKTGEGVQVYRPTSSRNFPPSRVRMQYIFASNGRCEFYFLSPDDNHNFKPCRWKTGEIDHSMLEITTNAGTMRYRILGLSNDILRLMPLLPQEDK